MQIELVGDAGFFLITYDECRDAAEANGGVAAEAEVGGEGAEDGGEVGGAAEDVERHGGAEVGHVEDGGEVHHQVRRGADAAKLLERLVPDHERHRLPPPVPDLPPGGVQRVVMACAVIVDDRENGVAAGGRRGVFTGAGDGGARHRRSCCGATHVATGGGVQLGPSEDSAPEESCRVAVDGTWKSAFRHLLYKNTDRWDQQKSGGFVLSGRCCQLVQQDFCLTLFFCKILLGDFLFLNTLQQK